MIGTVSTNEKAELALKQMDALLQLIIKKKMYWKK